MQLTYFNMIFFSALERSGNVLPSCVILVAKMPTKTVPRTCPEWGLFWSIWNSKKWTEPRMPVKSDDAKWYYVQVVLCQTNIFCHQLSQNTDFVRFTNNYTNCSEIQSTSLQFLNFRKIYVCKSVVVFWDNWWHNMMIWKKNKLLEKEEENCMF